METGYVSRKKVQSESLGIDPILKGIGIGLLVDLGIVVVTFGGFFLNILFGKQDYSFILVIPPTIGGILGLISVVSRK